MAPSTHNVTCRERARMPLIPVSTIIDHIALFRDRPQ